MENKQHNYGLDLLRIVATFMIILHHFALYTNFITTIDTFKPALYGLYFIGGWGKAGVIIFILITGYFTVEKTETTKNIIKTYFPLFFYSVLFTFINFIMYNNDFHILNFITGITPFFSRNLWFVTDFIILLFFAPFLNIVLKKLSKKEYQHLIFCLILILNFVQTINIYSFIFSDFIYFIEIYIIAAYIKLHMDITKISIKKCVVLNLTALSFLIFKLFVILFNNTNNLINSINSNFIFLFGIHQLPIIVICVTLFIIFFNFKIKNVPIIEKAGKSTYGIYLIHDIYFARMMIWNNILHFNYENTTFINILYSGLYSSIIIFGCCSLIELLRIYTTKNIEPYFIDKTYKILCKLKENVLNYIEKEL